MEYVLSFFGLSGNSGQKASSAFLSAYWHLKDHFVPHHRNNYHPHVLSHRTLGLFSALLITVKIFSIGLVSFGPLAPAFSSAITQENIISLTNASRAAAGIPALKANSLLSSAAQSKANDMLAKSYFSHNTPDGKTPWDFIVASGYNYLTAGENLAVNFTEAEDVENAWMNSPGHKANIVNKSFEEIGIGISQGMYEGKTAIFVVQMFGSAAVQKVALSDTPTAVAPPSLNLAAKPDAAALLNETQATLETSPAVLPETENKKTVQGEAKLVNKPEPIVAPLNEEVSLPNLEIGETSFVQEGGMLKLTAQIFGEPVKVLAKFGKAAVMMLPQSDGTWFGEVSMEKLGEQNTSLVLEAQNIKGVTVNESLASFAGSTAQNFNIVSSVENKNAAVSFMGKVFHPKNFEQQFYLIFIAVLLSCLILAIAIKRHVQHLPLIANASFVVILAVGLMVR